MKIAAEVTWVAETCGVAVAKGRDKFRLWIPYPHAAIWALIAHGTFSPGWAREVMALLMSADPSLAGQEVERTLGAWRERGLIEGE